jgi:hypothetical protein
VDQRAVEGDVISHDVAVLSLDIDHALLPAVVTSVGAVVQPIVHHQGGNSLFPCVALDRDVPVVGDLLG